MTNLKKFNEIFKNILGVTDSELSELRYQGNKAWDSVGHMALMAGLEESFEIMLDTEDIIDFSSYEKGKEILGKYGIEF